MRKSKESNEIDNNMNDEIYEDNNTHTATKKKGRPASTAKNSNLVRRRQVHVKCEHRRRKEIQEALEELEAELPETPKPRSKGAIIEDSAEMIKDLTFTLDRLLNENQLLLNRMQVNDLTK